ncbi:MAG: hypothetical protein GEU74_14660 [Nitriliruptorales bacterium]|nr:hypothetical protein [Nitriliruptorales bacterium]
MALQVSTDGSAHLAGAGKGVTSALGHIVAPIPAAVADGTWERLKVCRNEACHWAFYDRSRNRSRRWCTMEVCGNREKTQVFRQRHSGD